MATGITLDNLSKVFGSGDGRVAAVDGVSLSIDPGELFFLLGPSGCGKTTLLRMIAGFTEPSSGAIRFDGRDVTAVPANKRNTGMVFQSYALWPHMTVRQNVAFGLDVRRLPASERARRITEALEVVRMENYAGRRPNELSGGQQQRVALARALVVRPEALLLDEPLSNLDARLRADLRAEIRRICKDFGASGTGITAVYVTHDQAEALSMADRIAILDRGRVVQAGPPASLYRRPATRFVAEFLGEINLVEGTLGGGENRYTKVYTPIGTLASANPPPPGVEHGGRVLCGLRPESITPLLPGADEANVLPARIVRTTFLGQTRQDILDVKGVPLKAVALGPSLGAAQQRLFRVEPDEVVLLPP